MKALEQYEKIFIDTFQVTKESLPTLKYQGVQQWDSVGHMQLVASLEDAFGITMDTDDIIDFNSFEKGKEILKKYAVEL